MNRMQRFCDPSNQRDLSMNIETSERIESMKLKKDLSTKEPSGRLTSKMVFTSTRTNDKTITSSYSKIISDIYRLLLVTLILTLLATNCGYAVAEEVQPSMVAEPADTTANLGDEVVFKCAANFNGATIQWTRNGFGLGLDPDLPGYPRYSLTAEGYLRIEPMQEEDVGEYQCQVSGGVNQRRPIKSRSAKLSIQLPPGQPQIMGTDDIGSLSVGEGGTGFLECVVDGAKPAASITWHGENYIPLRLESQKTRTIKDDETQTFQTISSVRFHVDRSMQNKSIICSAENIASKEPTTAHVLMNVLYKPTVTLGHNFGAGVVREFDTVSIQCNVDSNPAPYGISWRKNGVIMPGKVGAQLLLENIDSSFNNAVIECEARNSQGAATQSTTLKLLYAPKIIINPKSVAKKEGTQIKLRCMANSNPPPRYVWYKLSNPEEPIGFTDTLDRIVSHHTVGEYVCEAIVDGFPSVKSKVATVSQLEAPRILKSYEPQSGHLGTNSEITCPIDTMVLDNLNVTWYFKGSSLKEGGKYLMGQTKRDGGVDAVLRIRDSAAIDFGEYGCKVSNQIGDDYATIVLEQEAATWHHILLQYLPYIGSAVGGIALMSVIMLIIYCCRSKRKNVRDQNNMEEGYLENERPIIKNMKTEPYRGSFLAPDILDRIDSASMGSQADSLSRLVNRPLQNLPSNVAGYYGNPMLNSRMIDDDRMSSSASESQYPLLPGENWGRPPMMGSGRRRSHSPYTTGSEMVDFSANSTMSSVMSKGSRSSRSQPESAQSSGEETPLMNRRLNSIQDQTYRVSNPGPLTRPPTSKYYIGEIGGGSHSDGEEMTRPRRHFGGGGNLSDSEEDRRGGGGARSTTSGYYSDGGNSRSGRASLARMRRVSEEENHDGRDEDELHTLSE